MQDGRIRYWALIVSVVLHTGVLAVFTGLRTAGGPTEGAAARPMVTMHHIERIVEQPAVKPVPMVAPVRRPEPVEQPQRPSIAEPEQASDPAVQTEATERLEAAAHEGSNADTVEFFWQKSVVRRVCYVVDCSGSMYGQMYLVKEQLKESILNLGTQQSFCVLFYMNGGEVLKSSSSLEPATAAAKSRALRLIDAVRPQGTADATGAMEAALQMKGQGGGAEVIYFLTDGFDLGREQSARMIDRMERLRARLAPHAVVHTIGFWVQPQDKRILKRLSAASGGEFVEIR